MASTKAIPKALSSLRAVRRPIGSAALRPLSTSSASVSRGSALACSQKCKSWQSISTQRQSQQLKVPHTRGYASASELRKTPLYDLHVRHGGTMVEFGGHSMPVEYDDLSLFESHQWTRNKASLFDVSHMVQHFLTGPGAQNLLERITPAELAKLAPHHSTLSCLLVPVSGGIVDDSVITRIGPDTFYFVTNAGCRDKDLAFIQESIEQAKKEGLGDVKWDVLEGKGLVALQGPKAAEILQDQLANPEEDDLKNLYFGQSKYMRLRLSQDRVTEPVLVSRAGYTGEDGFEISIENAETEAVVEALLQRAGEDKLRLAGLGARDSLRLEAGMCLYGHDLDENITPVEGGLSWVIGKERRIDGGFNGSETILRQLKPKSEGGGVERRRVGMIVTGPPAREGAEIQDTEGNVVGKVTSGCPSPTLGKNIAMGYVKTGYNKAGTELVTIVRGKPRKAVVEKMPFVPSKYYRG